MVNLDIWGHNLPREISLRVIVLAVESQNDLDLVGETLIGTHYRMNSQGKVSYRINRPDSEQVLWLPARMLSVSSL